MDGQQSSPTQYHPLKIIYTRQKSFPKALPFSSLFLFLTIPSLIFFPIFPSYQYNKYNLKIRKRSLPNSQKDYGQQQSLEYYFFKSQYLFIVCMSDQQIAFDDWEKEAELITINTPVKEEEPVPKEEVSLQQSNDNPEHNHDPHLKHLQEVERIKKLTTQEFTHEFTCKESPKEIVAFSTLLKAQKEFNDLAKNIGECLRNKAKETNEKVLPENQILTFFEEFLLYLYPNIEWESIEMVKQKIKIVKKDKKQEELKVKKLKEKEQRLKRAYGKQQNLRKQSDSAKESTIQHEKHAAKDEEDGF